jgi:hypothetical protein
MLIVSKRYHRLWMKDRSKLAWTEQVYNYLLALKSFWRSQGINRY